MPGEDCLSLNIWSPDLGSTRLPVMVWIPGGMFEFGTGATSWYDGSRFARDGIVCVTINYMSAPMASSILPKNRDSACSTRSPPSTWVQENSPRSWLSRQNHHLRRVGRRDGRRTLLSMPAPRACFAERSPRVVQLIVISVETEQRVGTHLAEKLGVRGHREALAAVPRSTASGAGGIESRSSSIPIRLWGSEVVTSLLPWQPVVDGEVIPAPPINRIADGAAAGVDIMVGTNTDEHRLFLVTTGAIAQVGAEALAGAVAAYGLR